MNRKPPEAFILSRRKSDLDRVENEFPDYLKLQSICWLLRLGAPSTEGVIFTESSAAAVDAAIDFAHARGWKHFMVRHDERRGQAKSLQGGFLIELDQISHCLKRFTQSGICMLLEPLDPILNGYNVSCLVETLSTSLEIAGPGFDASDLQRGQTIPHERRSWELISDQSDLVIEGSEERYVEALAERYYKIWWKFIAREPDAARWTELGETEIEAARRFVLSKRGSLLPEKYIPMPASVWQRYKRLAKPILLAWCATGVKGPAVLAGSFVQDGSFRFWDVSLPARWLSDPG